MRATIKQELTESDYGYHPRWGPLFRAGFRGSRFAKQICDYACMYTSRASNLGLVAPLRPFRPIRDVLPHDHFLETYELSNYNNGADGI